MPPRLPRAAAGRIRLSRPGPEWFESSQCIRCCFSGYASSRANREAYPNIRTRPSIRARRQSSLVSGTSNASDTRLIDRSGATTELRTALIDLQKHSSRYVNIARLQLALRGLEQPLGQETIRVAIIGFESQGRTARKVRELARLLLADPLKEEEEWERTLTASNGDEPILLRIAEASQHDSTGSGYRLAPELHVSSPTLNSHRLEILVLQSDLPSESLPDQDSMMDAFLTPTMEIPTSATGRFTPVATPVHKALVIGDGLLGAAAMLNVPGTENDTLMTAVDLSGGVYEDQQRLPFQAIDVAQATAALRSFRESLENSISYERGWFASGVPNLLDWIKAGTFESGVASQVKAPVITLISSLLDETSRRVQMEEARQLSALLSSRVSSSALENLRGGLKDWAERAHTELRDQLDIAFEGRRWRKLGWWKLFWRVDDVSMIASDILNQRFLTEAEKEIIYLAGRVEEAGVFNTSPATYEDNWAYKPPKIPETPAIGSTAPAPTYRDLTEASKDDRIPAIKPQPWPLHIPATRSYLSTDTVPALQALAQKLTLQTLTTSGFASAFAGLIYVSTLTTGMYEAGAVAALGIVWSLQRMQKKWETARAFWEGEVREEGRRAVRTVEGVMTDVLLLRDRGMGERGDGAAGLEQAKKAVAVAEEALVRVKS